MPDASYVAGDPAIDAYMPDFNLTPNPPDPACPAITHSYTYTMSSGATIDPTWIVFDTNAKYISFAAPVYVGDYDPVLAADIEITVTQAITWGSGAIPYSTAVGSFHINMTAGVMPCELLQFVTTPFYDVYFDIWLDAPMDNKNVPEFDLTPLSLASACGATVDVTYSRLMVIGPEFPEMWIVSNLPGYIDLWPEEYNPMTGQVTYPAIIEFTIL